MSRTVTVVDYGVGNLRSVTRALEECGARVQVTDSPDGILAASSLVLPGVGAFADGMAGLRERGLVQPIRVYASLGRPFLGICLGMQMMLDCTEEFGHHKGLGLIKGDVVPVPVTDVNGKPHKIPHIGWSEVTRPSQRPRWEGTVFEGLRPGASMYFVHSYMAVPDDPEHCLALCAYDGQPITAAIQQGALTGVQFHPEKSGPDGLDVLRRFLASDMGASTRASA